MSHVSTFLCRSSSALRSPIIFVFKSDKALSDMSAEIFETFLGLRCTSKALQKYLILFYLSSLHSCRSPSPSEILEPPSRPFSSLESGHDPLDKFRRSERDRSRFCSFLFYFSRPIRNEKCKLDRFVCSARVLLIPLPLSCRFFLHCDIVTEATYTPVRATKQ